jgi:hypothetical protein
MQPDTSTPDAFDWSPDNPDLVTERQPALAAYENAGGSVTIRQEADCGEDQDPVIVITKANVPDLVRALVRVAGVEMPAQLRLPPPRSAIPPARPEGERNASPSLFSGATG